MDYDDDALASLLDLRRSGGRLSMVQMHALLEWPGLGSEERVRLQAELAEHEGDNPELPPQPFTQSERGDYGPERGLDEDGTSGGLGQSDWFKRLKQLFTR